MKRAIKRSMMRFLMKEKGVKHINKHLSEYFRKTKEFIRTRERI